MEGYHSKLLSQIQAGWSKSYAKSYIVAAKQFIKWAYDQELLTNMPRNFNRRDLGIENSASKIAPFTNRELETLLVGANERMQLYLLLMANCGFTQVDIAELKPEQVDWRKAESPASAPRPRDIRMCPSCRTNCGMRPFASCRNSD